MQVLRDQPYGPGARQTADVYFPTKPKAHTAIIFWHGGSWQRGDKSHYRLVGRRLAKLGYITVIPNYRLYPGVRWPVFAEDAADVVAWVQSTYQPSKLVAMGHSAGGHTAAAVAFDSRYLKQAGVSGAIDGFIGLSGAYTFTPGASIKPILETGQPWQIPEIMAGQPVPSLLVHGRIDPTVSVRTSQQMLEALRARGGQAELIIYPHLEHMLVLAPLFIGWWVLPSLRRHLTTFIGRLESSGQ